VNKGWSCGIQDERSSAICVFAQPPTAKAVAVEEVGPVAARAQAEWGNSERTEQCPSDGWRIQHGDKSIAYAESIAPQDMTS
jgi:hypothetical protein